MAMADGRHPSVRQLPHPWRRCANTPEAKNVLYKYSLMDPGGTFLHVQKHPPTFYKNPHPTPHPHPPNNLQQQQKHPKQSSGQPTNPDPPLKSPPRGGGKRLHRCWMNHWLHSTDNEVWGKQFANGQLSPFLSKTRKMVWKNGVDTAGASTTRRVNGVDKTNQAKSNNPISCNFSVAWGLARYWG